MTKKYQRRDQRLADPDPIRLEERDFAIIRDVYTYRVLRQDQIRDLHFLPYAREGDGTEAAKRRLRKLYDHGFLERLIPPIVPGEGRPPTYYVLNKRGAELLQAELGHDQVNWYKTSTRLSMEFLEHTVAVNDVLVAVVEACRKHGFECEQWLSESQLKADYDYVHITTPSGKRERVAVVPDSFFIIVANKRRYPFFLELDRGTMQRDRFRTKMRAYLEYYRSRAYEKRFGLQSIHVLTVVATKTMSGGERRLANLKADTEQETEGKWFLFARLAELSAETILTTPVWYQAHRSEPRMLLAE